MTEKLKQRLLAYTRSAVDAEVAKCRLQAGRGVSLQGNGVRVAAQSSRTTLNDQLRDTRQASDIFLELIGSKCFFNLPPFYGQVPTLQGRSIYAWPRPFVQVPTAPLILYVKTAWTRTAVSVPRSNPEDPAVIAGLLIENVSVTIETRPPGDSPANVSPTGGAGKVTPFPGEYQQWTGLGEISEAGVLPYLPLPANGWGGVHEGTIAEYDDEAGHWSFSTAILYP